MKRYIALLVLPLLVFAACEKEPAVEPEVPPEIPGTPTGQYAWAELPLMDERDGVSYVTHWVTENGMATATPETQGRRRNFSIAFDASTRQPLWVAYAMHSWYDGSVGRNEKWAYDPYIPQDDQANLSRSYRGDFNRGHMIASDDRQRSVAMNEATYYYTNIAPQTQTTFNAGIWLDLENKVKRWGFGWADTLYVVTGSAFLGPGPRGEVAMVKDNSGNDVPVPSHFYKVLLRSKARTEKPVWALSADELQCVGFWLEHLGHATGDKVTAEDMMSASEIEELTGLEFFPILSDTAEAVKDNFEAANWGM